MIRRELLGYLVAALALGATKCVYDHGQRQAGVLSERLRVADSTAKAQTRALRSIDSAYRTDTAALGAALARYAAARQALSRRLATPSVSEIRTTFSDTVKPETSPNPVAAVVEASSPDTAIVGAMRRFVQEADSTIQACRSVVQTCEQRVAARDSLIGTLRGRARILEQQRPSTVKRWLERAAWASLVVLVSR